MASFSATLMMRASSGESVTCALSAPEPLRRGSLPDRLVDFARDRFRVGAGLRQNVGRDAALLLEQRRQHVLGRRLRVVFVQRARIRIVEPVGDALGHLIYVHCSTIISKLW